MKIIVADDMRSTCALLAHYLTSWGYQSDTYTEGPRAFEALTKLTEPAIAILDWVMPDMTGVEICRRIKQNPPEHPIYMILLTGKASIDSITEGLNAGADDFIAKPFDDRELRSRIIAGERIIALETDLMTNQKKLEKTNKKLQFSLEVIRDDERAGKQAQFRLLPSPDMKSGPYEIHFALKPSLFLSGDFLDYIIVENRYLIFYLVDVSGHGVSSAFLTVILKSYFTDNLNRFHAGIGDLVHNPSKFLKDLNTKVCDESIGKHLVLFYGILDMNTNTLRFSNGGQFPFPILRTEKETKFIEKKGFPIGLMKTAKYTDVELHLPEEFTLFFYSDGVLDILREDHLEEKQKKLLEISESDPSISQLEKLLSLKGRESLPDDVTLFRISRKSP